MAAIGTDILLIQRGGVLYKATASEIAALGAGGGSSLSGAATVNVSASLPRGQFEWTETVTATGVTPSSRIFTTLAPASDADENDPELLDLLTLSAAPGTNQITVTASFSQPTSGPINIFWSAF